MAGALARGVHVGTSGWTYDDWCDCFYPRGLPAAERLGWYARHFDTVEINATFYRLPTEPMIRAWNERLSRSYLLAVKGSRYITHHLRLAPSEQAVSLFFDRARALRCLKVVLWQLPSGLHGDVGKLERFMDLLPTTVRHAFELRDPSWRTPEVEELLRSRGAALVTASGLDQPEEIVPTADFLYLRFHGLGARKYRYHYSEPELAAWAEKLRPYLATHEVFAYFNNDYHGHALRNGHTLRRLLCGDEAPAACELPARVPAQRAHVYGTRRLRHDDDAGGQPSRRRARPTLRAGG